MFKDASDRIQDVDNNSSYQLVHITDKNKDKFVLKNKYGEELHVELKEFADLLDMINKMENTYMGKEVVASKFLVGDNMLEIIKTFQKEAKALGRDSNSVEEFKMWFEANEDELKDAVEEKLDFYEYFVESGDEEWFKHHVPQDWAREYLKKEYLKRKQKNGTGK